ncbi:MAG: DUF47 family protein, partial [Eubacteriales bacterium]|nr:DUF47 family protein [Eubacteriales bacterium]
EADCAKHGITRLLVREFITPIEREDIISLAQTLDTVVDSMEDILLRIYMYNVTELRDDIAEFSKVIVSCAQALNVVLTEFKHYKNAEHINSCIVAVNNYESEGDKLLVDGVRGLSVSGCSDRELFIWTDVYEHMESCLDACEDVADIIEEVVMKNT